jgi:signal transduction histidine kinase
VAVTALITATSQNGGLPKQWTAGAVAIYLVIICINVCLASALTWFGWVSAQQSDQRKQMVEELSEANQRLEAMLEENAGLHDQLLAQAREAGVLDERQRMAREIHDTLAQGLAGIITQLQAAQRSASVRGETEEHVARALALARSSLTEARRSVRALAPRELTRAHLPDALRTLTEHWSHDNGISAQIAVTGTREPLSPAIEVSLFRVVQEALTNVAKHAGATRVGVTLSYTGIEVLLDVRDDGRGFTKAAGTGFGLTSMRQRIRGVGGHVEVQSAPGEGTSVSARVPAIAPGGTSAKGETER